MKNRICKQVQKLLYNVLVEKWIIAILIVGTVFVFISMLHFGEAAMNWSRAKYLSVFNNFQDNLRDISFQAELSQHVPIDVVYTWVNGSDPLFLKDLKSVKESLKSSANQTTADCSAADCVTSHLVKVGCGVDVKVEYVKHQNDDMAEMKEIRIIQTEKGNITFFVFANSEQSLKLKNRSLVDIGTSHYPMSLTFWTTDWTVPHSVPMEQFVIASQVPSHVSQASITQALPTNISMSIQNIWLYPNDSLAVLELKTAAEAKNLIKRDISLDNHKTIIFHEAYLILQSPNTLEDDTLSALRFTDNEELRYSLRSLEKYAPWVRHVYLVTNGQIPYWLNIGSDKLTVVTHQEIFQNTSVLPTFSSPAIESNLHRIPGLSSKFLYLNDDVFLGAPIWPEDFFTLQEGAKIFLSWSLPDCSKGCPASWLGDGYCDMRCNTTQCMADGGDCLPDGEGTVRMGVADKQSVPYDLDWTQSPPESDLCTEHCRDDWIGDQMCDTSCDNAKCGFDAGDCDVKHVMHDIKMMEAPIANKTINEYHFNSAECAVLWNLAELSRNASLVRLKRHSCEGERSLSYSREKDLLVLVVRNNSDGNCRFNLSRVTGQTEQNYVISVTWNKINRSNNTRQRNLFQRIKQNNFKHRKLLDAFGDSLLYVNNLYNKDYGYAQRKVPAHMPHLLDVNILKEMERKYQTGWLRTGSQKLRSPTDMQYSFAYFHYIMQEKTHRTVEQIFDIFDTDKSGTLSDREIRTLLTKIHPLPIHYKNVQEFESKIIKCSESFPQRIESVTHPNERYFESKLPVVTKELLANCPEISNAFKIHFSQNRRFAHEVVKHPDVAFRQLTSNLSMVVGMLDTLRKWPSKFYCINDNTDPDRVEDNEVVRAVLRDFFDSVLPAPSMFELESRFRNRYLHISELRHWILFRSFLTCLTWLCFILLLLLLLLNYYNVDMSRQAARWAAVFRQRGRKKVNTV